MRHPGPQAGARRRRAARVAAAAGVAVAALAGCGGGTDPIAGETATASPAPSAPAPSTSSPSATGAADGAPDVVGLPLEEAIETLESSSWTSGALRWVPSEEVPEGAVVDQVVEAGGSATVDLVVSDGGPVRDVEQLPEQAAALLAGTAGGADPDAVRVFDTEHGEAFKTDELLVGPCAAVDAAYRESLDPRYGTRCW